MSTTIAQGLLRRAIEQKDENIGSAKNASISTLLTTLVTNLVVFSVMVLLFMILRRMQKRYYMPKTYVETVPEYKRKAAQRVQGQEGFLSWVGGVGRTEYGFSSSHERLGEEDSKANRFVIPTAILRFWQRLALMATFSSDTSARLA